MNDLPTSGENAARRDDNQQPDSPNLSATNSASENESEDVLSAPRAERAASLGAQRDDSDFVGTPNLSGFQSEMRDGGSLSASRAEHAASLGAQSVDDKDDGSKQESLGWPPPNTSVLTTDEAREYFYREHEMFFTDRQIQRLATPHLHGEILGKKVPRKQGGGEHLQVTQPSLDAYAIQHPDKKNAKDTPLDPSDKLFAVFRQIREAKDWPLIIDSSSNPVSAPSEHNQSAPQLSDTLPPEPAPQEKSAQESRPDGAQKRSDNSSELAPVSREMFNIVLRQAQKNERLFEQQSSRAEQLQRDRDEDREEFDSKRQQQEERYNREREELITDLTAATNTAIQLKLQTISLKAAYNEVMAHLPPGIKLHNDLADQPNADQLEIKAPEHPIHVDVIKNQSDQSP